MSLRGGVPTPTRCLTQVTLCGVLTHLPSLMSSELIHTGTTDGNHLVYQVKDVKSFGIHRRGQPVFIAGSPGIPLSPFSDCRGANGRKAEFPGAEVLAGNLRSHRTEGPRGFIKRTGLQLPASTRPFIQGTKWHLGPAITTTLSQRWLHGPCFLGHPLSRGRRTTGSPGPSAEELPPGHWRKSLPLGLECLGFWARSVSTDIKD